MSCLEGGGGVGGIIALVYKSTSGAKAEILTEPRQRPPHPAKVRGG